MGSGTQVMGMDKDFWSSQQTITFSSDELDSLNITTRNQNDHVLISKKYHNSLLDVILVIAQLRLRSEGV